MKKYLVSALVAVMSFVSLAPALAHENEGNGKENRGESAKVKTELRLEVKGERKDIKDHLKDLAQALRFAPKAINLAGKLVSVNIISTSSAEITVNVARVSPGRPKKMPTSTIAYPQVSTTVTFKITDKTSFIKAWGGKMTISEMTVGDELHITAKFNADGSVDVRLVKDNSLHVLRNKKGIIESINAGIMSFVLKQDNRSLTVKTDANTKFYTTGNTSTSFSSLQVGSKVKVGGVVNTNTNIVNAISVKLR